jgi:hypothetical protein
VTQIRSYRRVFDLERRIYRIDRLRLNPGGVPLRGLAYLLAAFTCVAIFSRLPAIGVPLRALPWWARFAALPGGVATVLTVIRIDGRAFHLAALSGAREALEPRWTVAFRACDVPGRHWDPGELIVLPDGSEAWPRSLRYVGPGLVIVRRDPTRTRLLDAGQRMRLEPDPPGGEVR